VRPSRRERLRIRRKNQRKQAKIMLIIFPRFPGTKIAAAVTAPRAAKVSNSKKYFYFPIKARSFGIGPGLDLLMRH